MTDKKNILICCCGSVAAIKLKELCETFDTLINVFLYFKQYFINSVI